MTSENDGVVDFLLDYVAAEGLGAHEARPAEVFAAELARHGFEVERDDWGNVIGTRQFGDGPTLLVDTHLDTVDVSDRDSWTRSPAGELFDGRVYGRGTVDMKGAAAAAIFAAGALAGLEHGTLVIAGTVAEELVEGPALIRVCERVRPDAVIIAEPSDLKLIRAQRGRAEIVVTVTGKAAHSAYPAAGVNAVEAMADVTQALRALPTGTDPVLGDGAMVVTDIVSSPYPGASVVPVSCRATYDRRLVPGEDRASIVSAIEALAAPAAAAHGAAVDVSVAVDEFTTYTGVSVREENFALAWVTELSEPIMVAAETALGRVQSDVTVSTYRFCTNGSGSAGTLGIPTIGFGPGEEARAHTADESILVADLHAGVACFAAIFAEYLTTATTWRTL